MQLMIYYQPVQQHSHYSQSTGLNVRTSVHKMVFFTITTKFGVYVEVYEWYTTECRMTRSKVKVKVMEVPKLRKMADFTVYLLAGKQKTNGEL